MDVPGLQPPDRDRSLAFDRFTVDLRQRALYHDGQRVHLTVKPLETLIVLLSRPGETVGKQELLDRVWAGTAVTDDVLVQAIGEIRRALGEKPGEDRFVQTVPRLGYRFVMPVISGEVAPVGNVQGAPGLTRGRTRLAPTGRVAAVAALVSVLALTAWIAATPWSRRNGWLMVASAPEAGAAPARLLEVSTVGTMHAAGVVARVEGDANGNAEVTLEWRTDGDAFRPAHALARIDGHHFAGSLFWLAPGTAYTVRVTLTDPDDTAGPRSSTATVVTEPDESPQPTLGVLHVSPAGSDRNEGTSPQTALRTIQRAADLARPGDLVLIAPGIYREAVRIRRSGTRIQPLVFRGAGPGAILDGADVRIAAGVAWIALEDGLFVHTSGFRTTHVATELGRLFHYASLDDLRALRAGAPGGFFSDGTRIYVKFSDHSSPARHSIQAARLERGIDVDGQSFVSIENLEFRHYGGGGAGIGIFLRHCVACRVSRCRIGEVGRAGVWVEGGERGRIEDNDIRETSIARWPWHEINRRRMDAHGIFFSGPAPRGFVVRRNRIRGMVDGIAPCGTGLPPAGLTTETDVYDNVLGEMADDGIEAEPYCANLRIWGNRITGSLMAISTAPAGPGPIWIVRNIAYRFGSARGHEVWSASALKVNTFQKGTTGPVFVYHNTFVTDVPRVDAVALFTPGDVSFVRVRNNLLSGTRHAIQKVNALRWDGDGNDLYTTSNAPLVDWLGARYATIDAFRAATGQERNGFSAAPLLTDPAAADFTPRRSSPLIDRGVRVAGINDRFVGRAPDVGAIEAGEPSRPVR